MSFWVKKIPRPGDRGRFKYSSVVGERLIRRSGQKTGESLSLPRARGDWQVTHLKVCHLYASPLTIIVLTTRP